VKVYPLAKAGGPVTFQFVDQPTPRPAWPGPSKRLLKNEKKKVIVYAGTVVVVL
jgi:hypothetical protein